MIKTYGDLCDEQQELLSSGKEIYSFYDFKKGCFTLDRAKERHTEHIGQIERFLGNVADSYAGLNGESEIEKIKKHLEGMFGFWSVAFNRESGRKCGVKLAKVA